MDLEYRTTDPSELGFEDEEEYQDALMDHVQNLQTAPNDVMDSLVVMANICDTQALLHPNPDIVAWYRRAHDVLRATLQSLADPNARPDIKFEDPLLYFPDTGELQH